MSLKSCVKRLFFSIPLPEKIKNKIYFFYKTKKENMESDKIEFDINTEFSDQYAKHILSLPNLKSNEYVEYKQYDKRDSTPIKYIAYYLTQFHPNLQNDEWWGKGTTEWTNVSKAVPQFINHYQPRLPGELGYYDLRLKENFGRQIELANNYGIYAFCFYYYWFDGKRLLEKPLDIFLNNNDLNIKFCISWANENWTKRFSGTNTDILMKIGDTAESDIAFIEDVIPMFLDDRYYQINGKPVLLVYRPANLHNPGKVLREWREIAKKRYGIELYLIATQEKADTCDWISIGFDAETEFMPKAIMPRLNEINKNVEVIRKDFNGCIYNYKEIVDKKIYRNIKNLKRKVYPAVMPMWDNTARRNQNAVIFDGSTPELYYEWLKDDIGCVANNHLLDDSLIFLNAWNEWGEGAYLEPDRFWGYAYLDKTKQSIIYKENA